MANQFFFEFSSGIVEVGLAMLILSVACSPDNSENTEPDGSDTETNTGSDSDDDSDSNSDGDNPGGECQDGQGVGIEGNTYTFKQGDAEFKVIFLKPQIVRVWATPNGQFTDPTNDLIAIEQEFEAISTSCFENDEYYSLKSEAVVMRVYKDPIRFAAYKPDNETLVFEESEPLDMAASGTTQKLTRGDEEYFYGCGMQNGYFSHRDSVLEISVAPESDGYINWDDGGHPNPAPFYMSTRGYGTLRNTFAKGTYDFGQPVKTTHRENRFDSYYFFGSSLKAILGAYTEITGRPFLAPIWGFEFGDADCYNKDGETTADILEIANEYRDNDMPGGWMLPNDGYGCGYTDLPDVVQGLDELGFYTGLWTEDGLDQIEWEVGTAGTRACKLDIAWVWQGYQFALKAAKTAAEGLEANSDSRRFVWTTMGWAGTHRYAVMWTGDNCGEWEYIRFQIPTVIGSGLTAQNYATGDVDGIFWGSPQTYVRDLQWKVFTPSLMTISGWAQYDKQPWRHGEPYTTYNRQSLKLKMRLTPYLYTYAAKAYETGVPIVRAMILEYPDDPKTWGTDTQYQFMSGEWFLVAPVYKAGTSRDGIYLPEGEWIDYWDGTRHTGPKTIDGYEAPLEKLPVFVKAGAIIPMWPQMLHYREKPKDPITLDVYPKGSTEFELYEDDGVTQAHRFGEFAKQIFECHEDEGGLSLIIGESLGSYEGKPSERSYLLEIHTITAPNGVKLAGASLDQLDSIEAVETGASGWFYDPADRGGVLRVKTSALDLNASFELNISQ